MMLQAAAVECSSETLAREKENLIASLAWLIRVRWYAIVILGVISVAFLGMFGQVSVEGPLVAVLSIVAIASLCNSVFAQKMENLKLKKYEEICKDAWSQVILDIWVIVALVHYCGGVENPLIVATVLPLIVASHLLPSRTCNILALFALTLTAGAAVLEVAGVLPHVQLSFTQGKALWLDGGYIVLIMGALAFLFFGSIRFSTLRLTGLTGPSGRTAEPSESFLQMEEKILAIEANLAAERDERAGSEEELRRRLAAAEQEKNRLAKAVVEMEEGIISKIGDLSKEMKELKGVPESVAADLQEEIARLEKNLEALEDARTSATPVAEEEKGSRKAASRRPQPLKKEDEEDEGSEEGTEVAPEASAAESFEDEDDGDEQADTESDPYEFNEEKEEDEEFEGAEKDEPFELEEDGGSEEFADPRDIVSKALLDSIREIKDIPQAESVLMDVVLADDLPGVAADQQMLGQLFAGILRHSLASMPDGGRMAVHTSSEPDCVCVKITDTSEPAPDLDIGKILAAEKKIARKIKVDLSADANADEGAVYIVKIPL